MEIIHVKAKNIETFALEYFKKDIPVVPITPWRANSQIKNPFVTEEDILLIAAKGINDEILGYMGILPFEYPQKNGARIYWNTCWWTKPGEGAVISMSLLYEFLKLTGNRVLFSDLSEKTDKLFKSMKGYRHISRKGYLIRFRSGLNNRIKFSKSLSTFAFTSKIIQKTGFFKAFDFFMNVFYNARIYRNLTLNLRKVVSFEISQVPDKKTLTFIRANSGKNEITIPNKSMAKWWSESEWLVRPEKEISFLSEKYYFSSFSDRHTLYWLTIKSGEKIIGTACLSERDGLIKTPYLFYKKSKKKLFFKFLSYRIISNNRNHSLLSFHEEFCTYLAKERSIPGRFKKVKRYTAVSDKIKELRHLKPRLQDGDGDAIFT
jgi:hypothetical protein